MRLPALLSRCKNNVHKNDFGHVLIVAGSPTMLGAAALTGLSAMRSGAGLTTIGIAKSLNLPLQKKISNVIMTLPLPETRKGTVAAKAFEILGRNWKKYTAMAMGPGMTTHSSTVKLIKMLYQGCPLPLVVDADALNALAITRNLARKSSAMRILTPHPGEMSRLTGLSRPKIEFDRKGVARRFAKKWNCVVVLKGHRTVVASANGKVYVNDTGNSGMATAGSGDVLTGMIVAFLAQGLDPFEAAQCAVFFHGKAGDLAVKKGSKLGLIATDIIAKIPLVLK